jgi:hypothetical protein
MLAAQQQQQMKLQAALLHLAGGLGGSTCMLIGMPSSPAAAYNTWR